MGLGRGWRGDTEKSHGEVPGACCQGPHAQDRSAFCLGPPHTVHPRAGPRSLRCAIRVRAGVAHMYVCACGT